MADTQNSFLETKAPSATFSWRRGIGFAYAKRIARLSLGFTLLCGCSSQPTCPPNSQFPTYPTYPGFQQQPMVLPSGTTVPTVGVPPGTQPMVMAPNGQPVPWNGQPPVFGQPIPGGATAYPAAPGQPLPPGYMPAQPR